MRLLEIKSILFEDAQRNLDAFFRYNAENHSQRPRFRDGVTFRNGKRGTSQTSGKFFSGRNQF